MSHASFRTLTWSSNFRTCPYWDLSSLISRSDLKTTLPKDRRLKKLSSALWIVTVYTTLFGCFCMMIITIVCHFLKPSPDQYDHVPNPIICVFPNRQREVMIDCQCMYWRKKWTQDLFEDLAVKHGQLGMEEIIKRHSEDSLSRLRDRLLTGSGLRFLGIRPMNACTKKKPPTIKSTPLVVWPIARKPNAVTPPVWTRGWANYWRHPHYLIVGSLKNLRPDWRWANLYDSSVNFLEWVLSQGASARWLLSIKPGLLAFSFKI